MYFLMMKGKRQKNSLVWQVHHGFRQTPSKFILGLLCAVLTSHRTSTPSHKHTAEVGVALMLPRLESCTLNSRLQECYVVTIRGCEAADSGRAGGLRAGLQDIIPGPLECHSLLTQQSRSRNDWPPPAVGFCFCNCPLDQDLRPM